MAQPTSISVAGTGGLGEIQASAEAIDDGRAWLVRLVSPRTLFVRTEFPAAAEEEAEAEIPVPGSRGYDAAHWQRVVELWRQAQLVAPRTPVMWIAREVGRSEATVGRWLRTLRKKGLLTDTSP
jgi:hypothetical protein